MNTTGENMPDPSPMQAQSLGIERIGNFVLRYGLALVIFWVGCLKFTAYESEGVFKFASNSPLLSWAYHLLDVRNFSRALGLVEIVIAALIAAKPVSPKLAIAGGWGGIVMFLTTLSFLFSTPGVWQEGYGFPSLSPSPGQFLAKDLVFLGAAIWSLGDAHRAAAGIDPSS